MQTPDAAVAAATVTDMLARHMARTVKPPLPPALWCTRPQVQASPIVRPDGRTAGRFVSCGQAVIKVTVRRPPPVSGGQARARYAIYPPNLGCGLVFHGASVGWFEVEGMPLLSTNP